MLVLVRLYSRFLTPFFVTPKTKGNLLQFSPKKILVSNTAECLQPSEQDLTENKHLNAPDFMGQSYMFLNHLIYLGFV